VGARLDDGRIVIFGEVRVLEGNPFDPIEIDAVIAPETAHPGERRRAFCSDPTGSSAALVAICG
jgi:hypothetical protein